MQNYYYQPQPQMYQPVPRVPTPMPAPQPQPAQQMILRGRPVSSLEEVKAAAVDFDGLVTFFPDLAHGKIYTKQCNLDGTASLNMYSFSEISTETAPVASQYVTREEFANALAAIKEVLNQKTKIEPQQNQNPNQAQTPQEQTASPEFNF